MDLDSEHPSMRRGSNRPVPSVRFAFSSESFRIVRGAFGSFAATLLFPKCCILRMASFGARPIFFRGFFFSLFFLDRTFF